ncbi:MAG: hypothetical protein DRI39_05995 [Chloroflexi bacterium]|nr:MAG: hypothetical protein DRI39_05995 [Chloroflexota bacterium]
MDIGQMDTTEVRPERVLLLPMMATFIGTMARVFAPQMVSAGLVDAEELPILSIVGGKPSDVYHSDGFEAEGLPLLAIYGRGYQGAYRFLAGSW